MPLLSNGEVDLKALREILSAQDSAVRPFDDPESEVEQRVLGIWKEVLGRASVGVRDDFFHIGGHSLLGAQVMSRINNAFGLGLPLRTLFECPNIRGLAQAIEDSLIEEIGSLSEEDALRLLSEMNSPHTNSASPDEGGDSIRKQEL
jgi:acyl carrier protein